MSRFEFRVARLEKSFAPPDAASLFSSLTEAELGAVILAGHKDLLAEAKTAGDKPLAADLAAIIRHDAAKLRGMPDAPHWRRTRRLVEEAHAAKDTGGEFEGFLVDGKRLPWRQYLRHQAEDIRFCEQFGDVLERLADGETVEFMGENDLLLAAARMEPTSRPNDPRRNVEMVSGMLSLPRRREYVDLSRSHDTPWTPWRRYCEAAEKARQELAQPKAPAPKGAKVGRR